MAGNLKATIDARFVGPVMIALGVLYFLLYWSDEGPMSVVLTIFSAAFGSTYGLAETLVAATPVAICAMSVAIAARVGLMSVGAEGQLYVGAAGATTAALTFAESNTVFLHLSMVLTAAASAALLGAIPAFTRAYFNVNETISTLLLNYVAILFVAYLVHGPLQDPGTFSWPQSKMLPESGLLPRLQHYRVHLGTALAVVLAIICSIVFRNSVIGLRALAVGKNPKFAAYANIRIQKYLVVGMLVSASVAGFAGYVQLAGVEGRLREVISPGYGYSGFLVAWIAGGKPMVVILVSVLFGALVAGADGLQLASGLPYAMANIVQGLVLLAILVSYGMRGKSRV